MKYAFILGSNVFVVPSNIISFTDAKGTGQFLRILSYHSSDTPPDQKRTVLTIDADIKDNNGHLIQLVANKPAIPLDFDILEQVDRILVTKPDRTTVLDVHQIDEETAMRLEHNISAELEVNMPFVAIRLRGNFMLGSLHIEIDGEKLFIDNNSYGNSVLAGKNDLKFSDSGVLI